MFCPLFVIQNMPHLEESLLKNTLDLINFFKIEMTAESVKKLLKASIAFKMNGFCLSNYDLTPIGGGVYLHPSLINHSCDPNCFVMFDGKTQFIQAYRDIAKNEVISISYINLKLGYMMRQNDLF